MQYRMLAVLLEVWPVLLGVWPVMLGVWLGRFAGRWFGRSLLPITSANTRVQRPCTAGAKPKKANTIPLPLVGFKHSWAFEKQKTTRDATGVA